MKKILSLAVVLMLVLTLLAGCSSGSSSSSTRFTNRYGTASTKCAHTGCTRNIASSGDTNCCATHSNRCGNCRCYIDEDAMYCMACLRSLFGN